VLFRVLVGGDQGELRCAEDAGKLSCYGVSPGDDNDPTQLIEVDARTGDSNAALNLSNYEGYSVGGSVIDPALMLYHFVAVGKPHFTAQTPAPATRVATTFRSNAQVPRRRCNRGGTCPLPDEYALAAPAGSSALPSDQWLVTIDLKRMAIIAEAPLSRNFMGPLSVSQAQVPLTPHSCDVCTCACCNIMHHIHTQGLATFNAEGYGGLVAVNYVSGRQRPLLLADFGSDLQFCGAFSRNYAYVASAYPSPTRFYAVEITSQSGSAAVVVTNATFESSGIVFAAAW
jgi:hypothetical protein